MNLHGPFETSPTTLADNMCYINILTNDSKRLEMFLEKNVRKKML